MIVLPWNATMTQISDAITTVQARCKKGLCDDPVLLAAIVRRQVDTARKMAVAIDRDLPDVFPSLQAWGDRRDPFAGSDSTVVTVRTVHDVVEIFIDRGQPWSSNTNGEIRLSLGPKTPRREKRGSEQLPLLTDTDEGPSYGVARG